MKFKLEIQLGNDAMQTTNDVFYAIRHALQKLPMEEVMTASGGRLMDVNGNTVGRWEVTS